MAEPIYDVVVIGAGPGGYIAAIRAAQLGLSVACVEKEPQLGGTCLRIGCIPSKALLESTHLYRTLHEEGRQHGIVAEQLHIDLAALHQRKNEVVHTLTQGVAGLFKKNKIVRVQGIASLKGRCEQGFELSVQGSEATQILIGRKVIIATGSKEASLKGVELDHQHIGTSTEALNFAQVPKHLVVIGGGAIGLEMGSVWARLGSQVTVLEYADRILAGMDAELAKNALKLFGKQGLLFRLNSRVTAARRDGDCCIVEVEGSEPLHCDKVLLSVGRIPNTDGLNLAALQIIQDSRGRIAVDAHYQTNVPGIYAIGDVIAGPMLAHKAEEEGVACVEHMVTHYGHVPYHAIPYVVYTAPEVASVGKTEEQLRNEQIVYKKGSFPFLANARAKAMGDTSGFVKVLAAQDSDLILGIHMIGPHASELIAEAAAAMCFGASSEDLARVCHAHPTLAEALKEASLGADNRMLNL